MSRPADQPIVATPIFPVPDLAAAVAFYRLAGFEVTAWDAGYGWVHYEAAELLHLRQVADLDTAANSSACYLNVADADAWHSAWISRGIDVGAIEDRPWGMHEFSLIDPGGNLIRVGYNL